MHGCLHSTAPWKGSNQRSCIKSLACPIVSPMQTCALKAVNTGSRPWLGSVSLNTGSESVSSQPRTSYFKHCFLTVYFQKVWSYFTRKSRPWSCHQICWVQYLHPSSGGIQQVCTSSTEPVANVLLVLQNRLLVCWIPPLHPRYSIQSKIEFWILRSRPCIALHKGFVLHYIFSCPSLMAEYWITSII